MICETATGGEGIKAPSGFINLINHPGPAELDFDSSCHPPEVFQNTFTFDDFNNSLDVKGLIMGDGFYATSWWTIHEGGFEDNGVMFSLESELWDH